MDKDQFYNWEKMTVHNIMYLMIKWFGFVNVKMEIEERPEVASRVWYSIEITKANGEMMFIKGQRIDIIHRRLIEYLDMKEIRKDYVKPVNVNA